MTDTATDPRIARQAKAQASAWLRDAMRERDWTLADVASRVGCDVSTVVRWMGGRTPQPAMRKRLWALFDMQDKAERLLAAAAARGLDLDALLRQIESMPHKSAPDRD